jgi:hypothetical protein
MTEPVDSSKRFHLEQCALHINHEGPCVGNAFSPPAEQEAEARRLEELSAEFHAIYQAEARRQGDVRHAESYDDLPDNIKEFDRVLARHVLAALAKAEQTANDYGRIAKERLDRALLAEQERDEANERADEMARAPYGEYDAMRKRAEAAEAREREMEDIWQRSRCEYSEALSKSLDRERKLREALEGLHAEVEMGESVGICLRDRTPSLRAGQLLQATQEDGAA